MDPCIVDYSVEKSTSCSFVIENFGIINSITKLHLVGISTECTAIVHILSQVNPIHMLSFNICNLLGFYLHRDRSLKSCIHIFFYLRSFQYCASIYTKVLQVAYFLYFSYKSLYTLSTTCAACSSLPIFLDSIIS